MTKHEQLIECMRALEDGMIKVDITKDIWQNELIWWMCKAINLLIEDKIKSETHGAGEKEKPFADKTVIYGHYPCCVENESDCLCNTCKYDGHCLEEDSSCCGYTKPGVCGVKECKYYEHE